MNIADKPVQELYSQINHSLASSNWIWIGPQIPNVEVWAPDVPRGIIILLIFKDSNRIQIPL